MSLGSTGIYVDKLNFENSVKSVIDNELVHLDNIIGSTGVIGETGLSSFFDNRKEHINKIKSYNEKKISILENTLTPVNSDEIDIINEINTTFSNKYENFFNEIFTKYTLEERNVFFDNYKKCNTMPMQDCFIRSFFKINPYKLI